MAKNKIDEHEQKEKDFEESVNELNSKVQTLEQSEEDLLVSLTVYLHTYLHARLHTLDLDTCYSQTQIKQLTDKLDAADSLSADYERQANKLRLDGEKLEKDLADSEEKYLSLQDGLCTAMADLNNV